MVDEVIKFDKLTKDVLLKFLEYKTVINKDKILKNSEYERYNYKNIEKLIKEESLIKE